MLQAAWAVLLARYNRVEDVVFGITVSGRVPELTECDRIVGLFINTIPVRIQPRRSQSFTDLIQDVHASAAAATAHHLHPLPAIQSGSTLRDSLFDHLMIFDNYPAGAGLLNDRALSLGPSLRLEGFDVREETHYGFTISVIAGDEIQCRIAYAAAVYDDGLMKALSRHFAHILAVVSSEGAIAIAAIDILDASERRQLIDGWNATAAPFPAEATLVSAFESQVAETPDYPALIDAGRTFTFADVNQMSNAVAHHLIDRQNVQRDQLVAIMLLRSAWLLPGILGILKAGGSVRATRSRRSGRTHSPHSRRLPPSRPGHDVAARGGVASRRRDVRHRGNRPPACSRTRQSGRTVQRG